MSAAVVAESSRKIDREEPSPVGALTAPAAPIGAKSGQSDREDLYSQVLKAQAGDREALGAILSGSWPFVNRHCKRLLGNPETADDVTQDVMVRLCTKLPELKFPGGYTRWVSITTHRMCLDRLRTPQRTEPFESRELSQLNFPEKGGADPVVTEVLRREVQAIMRSTVAELSMKEKQVLGMFYIEGKSLNDIAAELKIPSGTVKRRLCYARINLRFKLELAGQLVDYAATPEFGVNDEREG